MSVAADHITIASTRRATPASRRQIQALGLSIAMLVPAAFWTAILAGASAVVGVEVTAANLLLVGSSIAAFLGAVCAPIMLRR